MVSNVWTFSGNCNAASILSKCEVIYLVIINQWGHYTMTGEDGSE